MGQGTYSNVYKARERDTGKIVALKKVRFDTSEPESVKFMAREIMILQKLDHPNVIKLKGLATSRMQYSLYLVFDFMQSDLTRVISRPRERLTESQVGNQLLKLQNLSHVGTHSAKISAFFELLLACYCFEIWLIRRKWVKNCGWHSCSEKCIAYFMNNIICCILSLLFKYRFQI